jgi:hypothetical protein
VILAGEPGLGAGPARGLAGARVRSASGRITIPFASADSTNRSAPLASRWTAELLIEVLKVHRRHAGELLHLALSEPHPGLALDRLDRAVEAAARALQRAQLAQPVRVTLDRQIQCRVGGMQVPHPRRPIGQPLHAHGSEHRLQCTYVTWLDPGAYPSLIAGDLLEARLAHGPQRQMIIKQAAQQLPPVNIEVLLKLGMRQAGSVRPIKKADQRLELLPAGGKGSPASR